MSHWEATDDETVVESMKQKSNLSFEDWMQFVDLNKVHDGLAANKDSSVKQKTTIKNQLEAWHIPIKTEERKI